MYLDILILEASKSIFETPLLDKPWVIIEFLFLKGSLDQSVSH